MRDQTYRSSHANPESREVEVALLKALFFCLIEGGVNYVIEEGRTPLSIAIEIGGIDAGVREYVIKRLLEKGAKVNAANKYGDTPLLMAATRKGDIDVVKLLLEKGAEVDHTNERDGGYTALLYAIARGNLDIVELLIEKGAKVNQANRIGYTPLLYASEQENSDVEVVRHLIENNANVNHADDEGSTPLLIAVKNGRPFGIVELLIEKGANVNHADDEGSTPLLIAVKNKRPLGIVELLIEKKANVNQGGVADDSEAPFKSLQGYIPGSDGKTYLTPLEIAVKNGRRSVVKKLLDHNALHTGFSKVCSTNHTEDKKDEGCLEDSVTKNCLNINDGIEINMNSTTNQCYEKGTLEQIKQGPHRSDGGIDPHDRKKGIRERDITPLIPTFFNVDETTGHITRKAMRERVRIARINQGMTESDLAEWVGCDVETIVAFEGGDDDILSNDLQEKIVYKLHTRPQPVH